MNENDTAKEIIDFYRNFKSVILATSLSDKPNTSYAPFGFDDAHNFYIFVSSMAKHAKNLLENPNFSAFFVENEAVCENIFARKRVTFFGKAAFINKDSEELEYAKTLMRERFGDFFTKIAGMPDFGCFKLSATEGLYVKGFGQAYAFTMPDFTSTHLKGVSGHNPHENDFKISTKENQ